MTPCSLASWSLDSHVEPTIRVGIVLPEDNMPAVRLDVPDRPYRMGAGWSGDGDVRSATMEIHASGETVAWSAGISGGGPAKVLRLCPVGAAEVARGSGVKLHGVITGRGFHWQKRFHPTIPGVLEFRAVAGRLLVVNELPLEEYLAGVIAGEMSGECPLEFLKSQCVVARSWVLAHTENKHAELPVDRCNDDCCQRYHGTTDVTDTVLRAVRETRGQALLDRESHLIDANYSKSCGGIIESPEHVWNVSKPGQRPAVDAPAGSDAQRFFPMTPEKLAEYLTGEWLRTTDVFCSPTVVPEKDLPRYLGKVDEGGGHFRWKIGYDRTDLEENLRRKFFTKQDPARVASLETLTDIRVVKRGYSGRATLVEIAYLDPMGAPHTAQILTEYNIRDALHERFLFSSAFEVEMQRDAAGIPTRITFTGAGWGHGAGLCQIGALGMAMKGYTCEQIVSHYFEGIDLRACY